MEGYPLSELPPEQPGEPDNPLDMEIAPAAPPDSEARDDVAARLASWNEYQEDWRWFTENDQMSMEEKIRLLMRGGEATERLFSRLPSNSKDRVSNPRSNRLFVPQPLDELHGHQQPQPKVGIDGMTDEERDAFWKEVRGQADLEMRQAEEPRPDNPDVG